MRDKFRSSANANVSSKSSERADRGRPRERENRQPGPYKDRSRERDFLKPLKQKSQSPRSKPGLLPLPTTMPRHMDVDRSRDGSNRTRDPDRIIRDGNRVRSEREGKRVLNDDRVRSTRPHERDIVKTSSNASKLRMDRDRLREGGGGVERDRTSKVSYRGAASPDREISRIGGDRDGHTSRKP